MMHFHTIQSKEVVPDVRREKATLFTPHVHSYKYVCVYVRFIFLLKPQSG